MELGLVAAVRLEEGIPKLLVKVSPATAQNSAKNLGEVTLKKYGTNGRSHVAVVHLSTAVPVGIVLMSTKLAELLGVTDGEQVHIARSERVRRSRAEEEGPTETLGSRSQSKTAGSLPPEHRRVWTEASPLFTQDPRAVPGAARGAARGAASARRTVHGRLYGTAQAKTAEELPEHFAPQPRYVPRTYSNQGITVAPPSYHHPPLPVAQRPPVTPCACPSPKGMVSPFAASPGSPGSSAVSPASASRPCVPSQCHSPGTTMRMTRPAPPSTNFAVHCHARPKAASPKVQSARNKPSFTSCMSRPPEAEAADWLPSSCSSRGTVGRGAGTGAAPPLAPRGSMPPASPPALIPRVQKADSRSPSPPHTPFRTAPSTAVRTSTTPPSDQSLPSRRVSTSSPKLVASPLGDTRSMRFFERAVSDGHSPSPPLPRSPEVAASAASAAACAAMAAAAAATGMRYVQPLRMPTTTTVAPPPPPPPAGTEAAQGRATHTEEPPARAPRELPREPPRESPRETFVDQEDSDLEGPPPSPSPREQIPPAAAQRASLRAQPRVPPPPSPDVDPREAPQEDAAPAREDAATEPTPLPSETTASARPAPKLPAIPAFPPMLVPKRVEREVPSVARSEPVERAEELPTAEAPLRKDEPPALVAKSRALVPLGGEDQTGVSKRTGGRYKSLGALQRSGEPLAPAPEPGAALDPAWRPPNRSAGGSLERSELGCEITVEVRRWLDGQTSGLQCSHVVMDKALTVLSNFKLSSGCELEVLGGPLGAMIGGYNEEDWLYQEIFSKDPNEAIQEAFDLLGFPGSGDWSSYMVEEISLAYRRQCLRGHPSRGGSARNYLKLQAAMELIRAFGHETSEEEAMSPRKRTFVLDDLALVRELELSNSEAAMEADRLPVARLEELNRALDEYILRQMCFKSEIVAEIARLHENSAYSILGVAPDASDAEIKKAYRLVAMQCHPDKGGDKAEFQELHAAYEKIMEQRRSSANLAKSGGGPMPSSDEEVEPVDPKPKAPEEDAEASPDDAASADGEAASDEADAKKDERGEEDATDAQLLAKSSKAAEEASRYAKTAADFAHQAAEAAETARSGRDTHRDALPLTKSIAHSAIVLTLTVVKAVRVVGYATMDVAAQCRLAARKFTAESCADCSTEAMTLGLEALNAALSCAEVTEVTAAELSRDSDDVEEVLAERFLGAAVRASLAAASASNAAMSAAIAAVEGNRQCIQAAQPPEGAKPQENAEAEEKSVQSEDESARSESTSEPGDAGARAGARAETAEEAALKRQITQRNNNHKVLQRLNAEILTHQQNVRQFLQANRQLIPEVSCEAKGKVQMLLRDYAHEVQLELEQFDQYSNLAEDLPLALKQSGLLAPLLQRQVLAIPVCPKARVLKMAALYDLQMTFQVLEQEIFSFARRRMTEGAVDLEPLEVVIEKVHKELQSYTDGAA